MRIRKRGCGWPKLAGGYIQIDEELIRKYGLGYFLIDPVMSVENFSIGHQGMQLVDSGRRDENGQPIYDLYDWIGEGAYPNVMDWMKEVWEMGLHQLVATDRTQSFPFEKLSLQSRYFAVHPKAGIVNPVPFYEDRRVMCEIHMDVRSMMDTCAYLHMENVLEGKDVGGQVDKRLVQRTMPSFTYNGFKPPEGKHEYYPAIFAQFPIGLWAKFLVYRHPDGLHEQTLKNLDSLNQQLFQIEIVDLEGQGEGAAI